MSANPSHPYACVTVHSTKDPPQVVTFSSQVRVGLLWILSRSTALTTYESCYERDTVHRFYFPLCFKVVQLKEHTLSTSIIVSGSFFPLFRQNKKCWHTTPYTTPTSFFPLIRGKTEREKAPSPKTLLLHGHLHNMVTGTTNTIHT